MDDEQARRVPYDRGNLYYADLDAQIRAKSHGKRGLYDMLAPLFEARENGKIFDQAAWEAALRHELGPRAVKQFHDVVIEGTTTIVPMSNAFGPCLERHAKVWTSADGSTTADGYEWEAVAGAVSTANQTATPDRSVQQSACTVAAPPSASFVPAQSRP
jgi:predicted metalloprotease with PDZ domain